MPTAGQKVGEALKAMLESKGVRFHPNHKVDGKPRYTYNEKNEMVPVGNEPEIFS